MHDLAIAVDGLLVYLKKATRALMFLHIAATLVSLTAAVGAFLARDEARVMVARADESMRRLEALRRDVESVQDTAEATQEAVAEGPSIEVQPAEPSSPPALVLRARASASASVVVPIPVQSSGRPRK